MWRIEGLMCLSMIGNYTQVEILTVLSLKFYAHETFISLLVILFAVCQYYSARINQELYVFRSARIFYMLWMWSEGW
jgi:hypothetical protein